MKIIDIIEKKKKKMPLSEDEISFWIDSVCDESVEDYQSSSLLMAILLNGMDEEETTILTEKMMNSGKVIDLSSIDGIISDKHSTGGVGDKTSLVLGPMLASCGLKIAKMSGRGLGHTGGTLDKLESIDGFRVDIGEESFIKQIDDISLAIVGQSKKLVPADQKLYALRDVTGTVDSIPLIASSIMSKKLAAGADNILLDVKVGKGAFMKNIEDAEELAKTMIKIGDNLNRNTIAILSDMDQPLGRAVGNSLELIEAIESLKGNGPEDLMDLCYKAGQLMLVQSGLYKDENMAKLALEESISSGKALDKLIEMVGYQYGNIEQVKNTDLIAKSKNILPIRAKESAYISEIDPLKIGLLATSLGAGRITKNDRINHSVGIVLNKKIGDWIEKDECLCTVFYDEMDYDFEKKMYKAFSFANNKVEKKQIVLKVIFNR